MASLSGILARQAARFIPPALAVPFARPAALFFHGVSERAADPLTRENHHDADTFHSIARMLKQHYDVLPLAALDDVLRAPARHPRALFLMSDDGYANTAAVAADILDDLELPWTLFVSTHHIDTGEPNPIFLARLFLRHAAESGHDIPHLGGVRAPFVIDRLRRLPAAAAQEALDAMVQRLAETDLAALLARYPEEAFLTWDKVRALRAHGVEIGAHGHAHWPMHAAQTDAWLKAQAALSRARIDAEVGPSRFFAYPFGNDGDVAPAAWRAVRDAGFDYGFTTLSGSLDASGNPYLMPRYGLGPRDTQAASLVPILRLANPRLRAWQRAMGENGTRGPVPERSDPLALGQPGR